MSGERIFRRSRSAHTALAYRKSKRNYCCPLEYQGLLARVRCSPGGGSVSVVSSGSAVMLSRSRELVVDGGGRVFVDCEFHMHNLSMFDNPIVWEKRQLSAAGGAGERTVLNIQGVVQVDDAVTARTAGVTVSGDYIYRTGVSEDGTGVVQEPFATACHQPASSPLPQTSIRRIRRVAPWHRAGAVRHDAPIRHRAARTAAPIPAPTQNQRSSTSAVRGSCVKYCDDCMSVR